jgi:DNA-binding response OmpR family regulator
MKILVADDEITSRLLLEENLQEWGYEVRSASDGNEARDIMESENPPRLAILDWMMPGMDGPELCRSIRESVKAQYTYTILLTSKAEKKDVILGMDSGADAFLTKPVDLEELKSRLAAGKRILQHQARLSTQLPAVKTRVKQVAGKPDVNGADVEYISKMVTSASDLRRDSALALAPRYQFGDKTIPMLGKIALLSKIGEGGMGSVYRGFNPRLQREVAVKVLSPILFREHSMAVARFYREAQIASLVKSEHLVTVTDIDQESGLVYLVMELVEGKTATDCLKECILVEKESGLPEAQALDICIAVTRGLAAAHAGGIIHRDLKPDNILIPFNDARTALDYSAAKLADLGIAREEFGAMGITDTNASLGTAGYMSPEQICNAKSAGKPADIFGLGATLYVLLCGQSPFMGNSAFDVFTETINRPHKPIQQWRPDISPTTAAILDICLAKRPEDRYAHAGALLEDLIYCRRLFDTCRPNVSAPTSNVELPRVVESQNAKEVPCRNEDIPARNAVPASYL